MKVYKKVRVDYEKEVVDIMTCDLCGKEQTQERYRENDWLQEEYHFAATKLQLEKGYAYPDNGGSDVIEFHVCPDCFEQVLVPFFESHGAKPTITETDW